MTWLRLFNPFYVVRLERDQARLAASAARLAESSTLLAARTTAQHAAEAETIGNALITIDGISSTLRTAVHDMTCGRTSDARILIESLLLILKGPSR